MKIKIPVSIPSFLVAISVAAFAGAARAQVDDAEATATDPVPALYRALVNAPTRTAAAQTEHREFCGALTQFLRMRGLGRSKPDLRLLLPTLARFATSGGELGRLLRVIGDPENAVSVDEYVALTMSGRFEVRGAPLRAGRAFQLTVGAVELMAGEVTAHQMTLLGALAPHLVDYADLLALLRAPGPEPFVRNLVSQIVLSPHLERFQGWPLTPHDWATILTFYDPTLVSDAECDRVVAPFESVRDARVAIAGVPAEPARLCLQNAAVRKLGPRSADVIQNMLAPLGLHTTLAYEKALWDAKEGHVIGALSEILDPPPLRPYVTPAAARTGARCDAVLASRAVPTGWRVIEGGRAGTKPFP